MATNHFKTPSANAERDRFTFMKTAALIFLFLFFSAPVYAELTDVDLDKIRLIVKDEVRSEITASEARMKQYVDLKIGSVNGHIAGIEGRFTGMEKQLSTLTYLVYALVALIVIAVGIPQIITTARESGNRERDRK